MLVIRRTFDGEQAMIKCRRQVSTLSSQMESMIVTHSNVGRDRIGWYGQRTRMAESVPRYCRSSALHLKRLALAANSRVSPSRVH